METKKVVIVAGSVLGVRALYLLVQGEPVTWRSMLGLAPEKKKIKPVTGVTYAIAAGPPAPGTTYATPAGPPDPTTQYATPAGPPAPTASAATSSDDDGVDALSDLMDADDGEDDE
jgi:hypothetical protein